MAGPAVIVIIAIGGVIMLGAAAFFVLKKWEKIKLFFKGKRIAILGPEGCGKTTLYDIIHKGKLNIPDQKIMGIRLKKGNILYMDELKVYIKEGVDIPGDDRNLNEWQKIVMESDIVLYLFNSKLVYDNNENYINRIYNDMRIFNSWKKEKKNTTVVLLVGTFADHIKGMEEKNEAKSIIKIIHDNINDAINQGDIDHNNLIIGSLIDEENSKNLVLAIIKLLYKKNRQ